MPGYKMKKMKPKTKKPMKVAAKKKKKGRMGGRNYSAI